MFNSRKRYKELIAKTENSERAIYAEYKLMKTLSITRSERDQYKSENEELRKANEQLANKNNGLEHAIVQANKHIDFLRKELFGSDGE